MDEKRLRELADIRVDEAVGNIDAVTNDLSDVFRIAKGNKNQLKKGISEVLSQFDTKERSIVAIFVANLADELDPDVG